MNNTIQITMVAFGDELQHLLIAELSSIGFQNKTDAVTWLQKDAQANISAKSYISGTIVHGNEHSIHGGPEHLLLSTNPNMPPQDRLFMRISIFEV